MSRDHGWIKLHRKLKGKGYYRESEYIHLWVHLLLEANHEGKEFLFNGKIEKIKPGELITGRRQLSAETGIQESKIERVLKCFESEQQIEQENRSKFRLIRLINWKEYQNNEQVNERGMNSERTASEQPVNTNKNDNNYKNEKKETPVVPLLITAETLGISRWTDEDIEKQKQLGRRPYLDGCMAFYNGGGNWRVKNFTGEFVDYVDSIVRNLVWK